MRLDDLRRSGNIDDRRGRGGGLAIGGLGAVGIALIAMFLGVDPSEILGSLENSAPQQQQQGPRADDKDLAFAGKVVGSAEDVWSEILSQRGVAFSPAILTAYDNATSTACGIGQSAAGPFYCPNDRHVYLDLAFFGELKSRFGAPGDFAQAYVIAHEYGHHIQNLLGTMERHQDELQGASARGEGGASVRLELQADCYSGVWANHANSRFSILETGDVEEGLRAASAVGDDTLEKQTQGYVVPDSFTHGSSEQRVRWFRRGLQSGDMDSCNTFAARDL